MMTVGREALQVPRLAPTPKLMARKLPLLATVPWTSPSMRSNVKPEEAPRRNTLKLEAEPKNEGGQVCAAPRVAQRPASAKHNASCDFMLARLLTSNQVMRTLLTLIEGGNGGG